MRRIKKVTVNGETKYVVYERRNVFSKWAKVIFRDPDTDEKFSELDAVSLSRVNGIWADLPSDIRKEVMVADRNAEVEDHKRNLYHISKWVDPEHSRQIEFVSGAREIGDLSDGYHTFNELYDFRREYNAALVNTGVWKAHKSHRHHDGELCFGGGWFIVMVETPFGQISNHYEDRYWDEFHCEEKEIADEWDGHTEKDVLERLRKSNIMK